MKRRHILNYSTAGLLSVGTMTGCCRPPCGGCGDPPQTRPAPVASTPAPHQVIPAVGDGEIFTSTSNSAPEKSAPLVPARTATLVGPDAALVWNQPKPQSQLRQETFSTAGYDADVAVDSSGELITFSSTRDSDSPHIYLQRIGGAITELTSGNSSDVQPAFSPDGKRVAFASNRSGNWNIYTIDVDGQNITQLTAGQNQDMHASFSPDGTRLVYSSLDVRRNLWELMLLDLALHSRKKLGAGMFPAWSTDKMCDRIVFQRAPQRPDGLFSIWTLEVDVSGPHRLAEVASTPKAAVVTPAWSPDGRQLAVATIVEAPTAKDPKATRQDIWIMNADGTDKKKLTDGKGANLSPCWSVNNRIYFISGRGGRESIWSIGLNPGSETLVGSPASARPAVAGSTDDAEGR